LQFLTEEEREREREREKMDKEECLQEQQDEHEALESMFMEDEFKIVKAVGEKDPWYVLLRNLRTTST